MAREPQTQEARLTEWSEASPIHCVYLTCFGFAFDVLATLLPATRIRMHRAETLEQADFLLTVTGGTVLLSDVLYLDGSWEHALDMLARTHPLVAFLLIADEVDRPFVSAAPDCGACAVLWRPFQVGDLRRLVEAAHEAARARVARECSFEAA